MTQKILGVQGHHLYHQPQINLAQKQEAYRLREDQRSDVRGTMDLTMEPVDQQS